MRPVILFTGLLLALCLISSPAMCLETVPTRNMMQVQPADMSARVAKLEQLVAALQQQVAQLQSVIRVSGNSVEIGSGLDLKIYTPRHLEIRTGSGLTVKSSNSISLLSNSNIVIKSVGSTQLSGSFIKLNMETIK